MFDIGWSELFVIAVIALIVIGPKDIPKVFYEVGKWVRKGRAVTREFQRHVDDMVRDAELEDLRRQANEARAFNLRQQIENTIDPGGDFRRGISLDGPAPPGPSNPNRPTLEDALSRAEAAEAEMDHAAVRAPPPTEARAPTQPGASSSAAQTATAAPPANRPEPAPPSPTEPQPQPPHRG